MNIVADLHIHSHYSRATSKNLTFENLFRWAQLKGVQVVGTGDIAHPGWLQEMREKLEPGEEGLYRLKDEYAAQMQRTIPSACQGPVRFLLAGEISNIYKKGERTRKVHNVVFAPSLEAAAALQVRLEKIGNIRSDGRPILGLDSRDLLETLLEVDSACHLIPAHIWTPWFSLLGSKSGFDSVDECFEDLTPHIFAVETGLSSDPPMNWRVSQLDPYTLVSSSDAHSPEKLAREATLFDTGLSYPALFDALKTGDPQTYRGTIEFFPEEGKYHLDGHRACRIVWDPTTTLEHRGICPVCDKEVTIGVMHRVEELADRPVGAAHSRTHPFHSLIPLSEVIGEVLGIGAGSARVQQEMQKLLAQLGPELAILREVELSDISKAGGERLAEGIDRMRRGQVDARAGYDGEYGVIRLFSSRAGQSAAQGGLFADFDEPAAPNGLHETVHPLGKRQVDGGAIHEASLDSDGGQPSFFDLDAALEPPLPTTGITGFTVPGAALLGGLNEAQREAVQCVDRSVIISAGPGTGKTRTLTHRIAFLVLQHGITPESLLAITFTNKAAEEMAERLSALLGPSGVGIAVKTFHAFAADLLRDHGAAIGIDSDFVISSEDERAVLLRLARPDLSEADLRSALEAISDAKNRLQKPEALDEPLSAIYAAYEAALRAARALDFDDLIAKSVRLLEDAPDVLAAVHARYRWISVDEYQDVNAAQVRLLSLLAQGGANLCVIGDPDQAIYGFRGADRSYFLAFLQAYPEAVALHLSENYRSTQLILDAAVQVISHESGERGVGPVSAAARELRAAHALADFAEQVKLDVYQAPTDRAEAEYVVHQIEQMVGGTSYFSLDSGRASRDLPSVARSFADFAVLYRLSAQNRLLIEALDRSGIPYQAVGQMPLHSRPDVRAVLAHLWLLHNPRSLVHWHTVFDGLKLTGAPDVVERVLAHLAPGALTSVSVARVLAAVAEEAGIARSERLVRLSKLFEEMTGRLTVTRGIERVWQFMQAERRAQVSASSQSHMDQLLRFAGPYGEDLSAFLQAVLLRTETDVYDRRADRITLMTLHAAKGLEFPVVFLVGCEEGLLPYARGGDAPDVDEERRLFYVGMTRAQQKLVLCHARKRVLFGQLMDNRASRFVDDIEATLKERKEMAARRKGPKEEPGQLALF